MGFGSVISPAPGVMGFVSLTFVVEAVCLIHLIVCIVFLSSASSQHSFHLAGVTVYPAIQCVNAAWFLLGMPVIVLGGVGAVYRIEKHLTYYLNYLLGSFIVCLVWFCVFAKFGSVCHTHQPGFGSELTASFVCGVTDGFVLFWILCLLAVVGFAGFIVWSMIEYVKQRCETELLRYQEPWNCAAQLAEDCNMEHSRKAEAMHKTMASNFGGMPWAARTPVSVPMHDASYSGY